MDYFNQVTNTLRTMLEGDNLPTGGNVTGDMGMTIAHDMEVCRMPSLPDNIHDMIAYAKTLGFGVGIHRARGQHKSIGVRWHVNQYAVPKEKSVVITRSAGNVFRAK